MPAATVDVNGKSINAAYKTSYFKIDQALLQRLKQKGTGKLLLMAEAVSFNNGNTAVKIYPEDKIVIKAGVKVKTTGTIKF